MYIILGMEPILTTYHDDQTDIQKTFDVSVVVPTNLKPAVCDAVRSIYGQHFDGTIQILLAIGTTHSHFDLETIIGERPAHIALTLFQPGYDIKVEDGVLQAAMSFLANSRYIAYLDEDHWFAPDHLANLFALIDKNRWVYGKRWFVDGIERTPICEDSWESVGPEQGLLGGFVDYNTLMVDMASCSPHIVTWPLENQTNRSDHIFSRLNEIGPIGICDSPSVSYAIGKNDPHKKERLDHIAKFKIPTGENQCPNWKAPPESLPSRNIKTQTGKLLAKGDHKKKCDISVVMPTICRDTIQSALNSIYQQDFQGRVQILIGIDRGDFDERWLNGLPDHMTALVLDPGYSTSKRHGGQHDAYDSGALRTILSLLAHADFVAYLDDDNQIQPHHLSSLHQAIDQCHYAYSLRRFIHSDGTTPISTDYWESLGPKRGYYAPKFQGFIDPNCLMIRVKACLPGLVLWTKPMPNDVEHMSADRMFFHFLATHAQGRCTNRVSIDYVINQNDPMHKLRAMYLGHRWVNADMVSLKKRLGLS